MKKWLGFVGIALALMGCGGKSKPAAVTPSAPSIVGSWQQSEYEGAPVASNDAIGVFLTFNADSSFTQQNFDGLFQLSGTYTLNNGQLALNYVGFPPWSAKVDLSQPGKLVESDASDGHPATYTSVTAAQMQQVISSFASP